MPKEFEEELEGSEEEDALSIDPNEIFKTDELDDGSDEDGDDDVVDNEDSEGEDSEKSKSDEDPDSNDDSGKDKKGTKEDAEPEEGGEIVIKGKDGKIQKVTIDAYKKTQGALTKAQQELAAVKKAQQNGGGLNAELLNFLKTADPETFNKVSGILNLTDESIAALAPEQQVEAYKLRDQQRRVYAERQSLVQQSQEEYIDTIRAENTEMQENPDKYPGYKEEETAGFLIESGLAANRVTAKQAYYMLHGENLLKSRDEIFEEGKVAAAKDMEAEIEKRVDERLSDQKKRNKSRSDKHKEPPPYDNKPPDSESASDESKMTAAEIGKKRFKEDPSILYKIEEL